MLNVARNNCFPRIFQGFFGEGSAAVFVDIYRCLRLSMENSVLVSYDKVRTVMQITQCAL